MTILSGIRIVEFQGLGPAPFCGMLMADLGADVILIERGGDIIEGASAIYNRGKRSIAIDLKKEGATDMALAILASADALIEGMRPGVMERLGLGPDIVHAKNQKLVYGRLTGWGQTGPLSKASGHDINFTSLSGAAWYAGDAGQSPTPPPTLVGDIGGGALYMAVGILAGVIKARETGRGSVVDAAIVDGSAHMMNLLYSLRAAGGMPDERGKSMLDGSHFYAAYQCADNDWISIGPLEPQFYQDLISRLGLANDPDFGRQFARENWPVLKARMAEIFKEKPRSHWVEQFYGTDVCFAPVLSPSEAARDDHMKSRNIFREIDDVLQAAAAPRFDGEVPPDPKKPPSLGEHTHEILTELGISSDQIARWKETGALL